MKYTLEHIAAALKTAREAQGLSQRALSELAGVPQSHISKIEKGAVDLRVSSLIELVRILDLELVLVPRKSVPAVSSIIRSTTGVVDPSSRAALHTLKRLREKVVALKQTAPTSSELAQLQRQIRDLERMKISSVHLETLRAITRNLRTKQGSQSAEDLRRILSQLRELRDRVAHDLESPPPAEKVRPAYSLEDDEHGE
jgi:DNA-binding XRE family transcriptional regulator